MSWADSHCHLDDRRFESDREELVARALEAGVERMISIGTGEGPPDLEAGIRMAERFGPVYASVGVHPHDAAKVTEDHYPVMRTLATHPKVVLLGEMGLDYFYDNSPRVVQRDVFRRQLELAAELKMPIAIHTRDAWVDTVECIREVWDGGGPGGVFHCFSAGPEEAREAVELGFHLGFGGVLTYPKAENVREAARVCPRERLLLETDAPYLAPVPHRGKRNEPAYVVLTATRLAEETGMTPEDLQRQCWKNLNDLCFAAIKANQ